jgi:hypothetical protein
MEIEILLTNSSDITRAVDELHDLWFDVAAIDWNRARERIRIPFAEVSASLAKGHYQKWLVVEAAQRIEIHDTEKVGFYDLDRITFKSGVLVLECGVPLKIEIAVAWEH